jgi:glycosyltransferase involved in cell wall biosynthesis
VVSNISGNRDMVEDGRSGRVVPPRDAVALAAALMELAADPQARSRMAVAARETASRFGWDEIARRYVELYTSLTSTRKRV